MAVEKSALYTFTELKDAIRNSFVGKTSTAEALKAFVEHVGKHKPEISLSAYARRFGMDVDGDKAVAKQGESRPQVPAEEYQTVYGLAQEDPDSALCNSVAESIFNEAKRRLSV